MAGLVSPRQIKFRQWMPRFHQWHRWGFMSPAEFAGPANSETLPVALQYSQQFTGLLDKNGVEIYEGDIIQASNTSVSFFRRVVEFKNGGFGYLDRTGLWGRIRSNGWSVIGNIYETPSLIPVTGEGSCPKTTA